MQSETRRSLTSRLELLVVSFSARLEVIHRHSVQGKQIREPQTIRKGRGERRVTEQ